MNTKAIVAGVLYALLSSGVLVWLDTPSLLVGMVVIAVGWGMKDATESVLWNAEVAGE